MVIIVKWTFISHVLFFSCLSRIHQEISYKADLIFSSFWYKQHLDPLGCLVILDRGLHPSCSETGTFEKQFLWMLKSYNLRNLSSWNPGTPNVWVTESLKIRVCVWESEQGRDLPKNKLTWDRWDQSCTKRTKCFCHLKSKDSWWRPNSGAVCPLVPGKESENVTHSILSDSLWPYGL